jgi:hypothetical protein
MALSLVLKSVTHFLKRHHEHLYRSDTFSFLEKAQKTVFCAHKLWNSSTSKRLKSQLRNRHQRKKIGRMKIDPKTICSGFPFYPHIIMNMFLARNVRLCAEAKT